MHIGDSGEDKTKKYPFTEFMENSEHPAVVHFDCVKEMLEKLKENLQRERMFYPPKDPQAVIEAKAKNWTDALKDLDTIRAKAKKKPSVAIDFDGTIAKYDHYRGKGVFGDPIAEAKNFIKLLKNMGWIVIINTTRSEIHAVEAYLMVHGIPFDFINYNPENEIQDLSDKKVLADVYVDDRAVRFDGSWQQTFRDIITARPWWKEVRNEGAE